jgi:hypothetical protein
MRRIARYCCRAATAGLLLVSALPAGCADPPDPLLAVQQAAATAPTHGKRLLYIGLALYSEQWSENDVVELADKLRSASQYHVVPMIASNFISPQRAYPLATDTTIATLVNTAAAQAGPDDIVFVDISTHGARLALARRIDSSPPTLMSSRELADKLAPLAAHRSIIVISACFSGSLIDDLQAPGRIVVTAARADRTSFGCAAGNRHTFFGEAELDAFGEPDRSLRQVFSVIRDDVAHMEQAKRYRPSEPQVSVGADAADLYDAPVF